METKPLLYGLIGFFIGGLLVSIAATTFHKPSLEDTKQTTSSTTVMTMDDNGMTAELQAKTGDAFDEAFIASMIVHHEDAINMAELAEKNAKHKEIKDISRAIILTQQKEIDTMKQWQLDWAYVPSSPTNHGSMNHDSMGE